MVPESSLAAGAKATNPAKRPANLSRGHARAERGARRLRLVITLTLLATAVLLGPLVIGGIWDPVELRVADPAARIAEVLFRAELLDAEVAGPSTLPTVPELGRGELPFTSIALGFRLFGMHDWAGRLPLALWVVAALVSAVVWAHRFFGARVAAWSALVFCSMPIVFFQARVMLGDAVTIGTSTASFVLLSLGCLSVPSRSPMSNVQRVTCVVAGLAFAAAGILCRGIAIGVAVPTLSVAAAYVVSNHPGAGGPSTTKQLGHVLAASVALIGLTSAVIGVVIAMRPAPQSGISLVLQGSALAAPNKMPTFETVVTQLGHGLFPWSTVLPFGLAAVFGRLCRRPASSVERAAISALALFILLNAAMQTWLTSLGASFPFPGVAALAVVIGIWLEHPGFEQPRSRNVLLGVVAIVVILLADFENIPDKLLTAATVSDAKLPASFKPENLAWLRVSASLVVAALLATAIARVGGAKGPRPIGDRIRTAREYLSQALGGQLIFVALLLEASLVTGAALVTATRFGLPFQRILYMSSGQRELLTWAWLILPALLLAGLLAVVLHALFADFYEPGFGLPRWTLLHGIQGRVAGALLTKYPGLARLRVSRVAVLRLGLFAAALLLSLGWSSRLSQQLSPRRALGRYHVLARPGERLGLLGVRPQVTQYYSKRRPELLLDAEEAADWILFAKEPARRWLLVKGDQFPRLNAAYREKCQCSRNIPVIDGRSSELFLVSNQPMANLHNENPLQSVLLDHAPTPRQKLKANFADQLEMIGWDLVADDGRPVAELKAGRKYELQLYFRVLARPSMDWEIFVHIDGYGRRYNADHAPVQGWYAMSNWRPGDYIVDRETIVLDPSFTEGNYELFFGFFKGSRRLEVKSGNHDDNRLLAGTIRVM